jgi:hypothetical protein
MAGFNVITEEGFSTLPTKIARRFRPITDAGYIFGVPRSPKSTPLRTFEAGREQAVQLQFAFKDPSRRRDGVGAYTFET